MLNNLQILVLAIYIKCFIFENVPSQDGGELNLKFNTLYYVQNGWTGRVLSKWNTNGIHTLETLNRTNEAQWWYFVKLNNGDIGLANKAVPIDTNLGSVRVKVTTTHKDYYFISFCGNQAWTTLDDGYSYVVCSNYLADWRYYWSINLLKINLTVIMDQVEYEIPPEDILSSYQKQIDLLERATIINDSPATLKQELSNTLTKMQSISISVSESLSQTVSSFDSFTLQSTVSTNLFFIKTQKTTTHSYGSTFTSQNTWNSSNSYSESKQVTYTVKKTVEVPPYQSINIVSYVDWIENITLPYMANVTIRENFHSINSMFLKTYLQIIGFNEELIDETNTTLTYRTYGVFRGTFGSDSLFSVTAKNEKCNINNIYYGKKRTHNKYSKSYNEESYSNLNLESESTGIEDFNPEGLVGELPEPSSIAIIEPTLECYKGNDYKFFARNTSTEKFINDMNADNFLDTVRIIFITHGYLAESTTDWLIDMSKALIAKNSQTVCIVGWGKGANPVVISKVIGVLWPPNYPKAAANTQSVGEWLATFAQAIRNSSLNNIKIMGVGHSLGAHLMGKAGRTSGVFDRISGLDPAGFGFQEENIDKRLSSCDAKFVDVIHTDGYHPWVKWNIWGILNSIVPYYGTLVPLGTVDFYPNYGLDQPINHNPWWPLKHHPMGVDFAAPNQIGLNNTRELWNGFTTSHTRVIYLYIWSINNPNKFKTALRLDGIPDVSKPVYHFYTGDIYAEMGYYADALPLTNGTFYLQTNAKEPWA